MRGLPVTIRTLDIGADKPLDGEGYVAVNPALGLRAIRYCLAEPQVFNTQLRAILRASRHGKVLILIPMLTTWHEIVQALACVELAREQLRSEGVKFDEYVPGGRHDRGAGGRDRAADVHPQARLPLDRHQRPDPVHARHRPRRRPRGAPLRSAAPRRC
jgi:hypothetical protein